VKHRFAILVALVLLVFNHGTARLNEAAQPASGVRPIARALEQVDKLTASELTKDKRGGVTIGVISRADLVWTKSYGYADVERQSLANAQTVYRIGSITKTITALALLQMVEAGTVRLSDQVEKYFPEVNRVQGRAPDAPPITLVQLATMTSGLAQEPHDLPTFLVGPVDKWEDVLISALPQTRYAVLPDTEYLYSNIGYAILGAALARAAHRPFTEYVQERILSPLGMTHTTFAPTGANQAYIAKGYDVQSDGHVDIATPQREHEGRGYKVPNGALYSTVGDLARYVSLMLGQGPEAVIKSATLDRNFTRVNSASGDLSFGYGIGFRVERRGELLSYGHGGSVAGYSAAMCYSRSLGMGVVVLRNVNRGAFSAARVCQASLAALAAG
jgi:CubicO group peptidase (beta-lactamase class C family)